MYKRLIVNNLIKSAATAVGEEVYNQLGLKKEKLSEKNNPALYALSNILSKGSGVDLTDIPVYSGVNLYESAYSPFKDYEAIFSDPKNTAVMSHEYGHAIDMRKYSLKKGIPLLNYFRILHPAIGYPATLHIENRANEESIKAFDKVVKNKDLVEKFKQIRKPYLDTGMDTYKVKGLGRLLGGTLGSVAALPFFLQGKTTLAGKLLSGAAGVLSGGIVGGYLGDAISDRLYANRAIRNYNSAVNKDSEKAMDKFNRQLLFDAMANDYYK